MPFFYIPQANFSLIRRSMERFQVTGILQYVLFIVSTCSAWKETLKWRGLCWQAGHTLPLLWFISTVSECATISSVSTQLKYHNCTHRQRERGKSVSSDCAQVQCILEELLLLGNASLSSSSVCHMHILMVGDSCFMPPPQLPWYMCRQVCRWKTMQRMLYPAQHYVLDQWQHNHRLTNELQVIICKVSITATIINEIFTVACALVDYAVITDDKFTLAISPSSLTLSGTQLNSVGVEIITLCTTDISSYGKQVDGFVLYKRQKQLLLILMC